MRTPTRNFLCTVCVLLPIALAGCGGEQPSSGARPRIFVSRHIMAPFASQPAGAPDTIYLHTLTLGPQDRAELVIGRLAEGRTVPKRRDLITRCIGTWNEQGDRAVFRAEWRREGGLEEYFKSTERRLFEFRMEDSGTRLTVLLPALPEQGNEDLRTYADELFAAMRAENLLTTMLRQAPPFVLKPHD